MLFDGSIDLLREEEEPFARRSPSLSTGLELGPPMSVQRGWTGGAEVQRSGKECSLQLDADRSRLGRVDRLEQAPSSQRRAGASEPRELPESA